MKSVYLYIIYLPLLFSCSSYQNSTLKNTAINNQTIKSRILFVNYSIQKGYNASLKVELIDKLIVEGNLKSRSLQSQPISSDDLWCVQLDANSKHLDTIRINNPLIKDIEYVDSEGMLGKKQIQLDSTSMSLRFQLKPQTKYISIQKNNNKLSKIKL